MAVKLYYFGLDRIMPTNCKETSTHINVLVLGRGLSDIKQLNGYGPGSSAGSTLLPTTPCTFLSMALSAVCLLRIAGFRDLKKAYCTQSHRKECAGSSREQSTSS